jgi:hypothetical protein
VFRRGISFHVPKGGMMTRPTINGTTPSSVVGKPGHKNAGVALTLSAWIAAPNNLAKLTVCSP